MATTYIRPAAGIEVGTRFHGNSSRQKAFYNPTDHDIVVKAGYKTTANGYGDEIVCPAGLALVLLSPGGPRDFAVWEVTTFEDMKKRSVSYGRLNGNVQGLYPEYEALWSDSDQAQGYGFETAG